MSCKDCCEPDHNGNYHPCCNEGEGLCEASNLSKGLSMCIHCGAEMFEENEPQTRLQ